MFDSKNIFNTALLVVVKFIKISNVYFDLSQCRLSEENNFLKTKTKFSYNLASGFGKNPKWEDMMQELNLVVGPEVGPLLKLTKNGKTVQDPGLIHEKEMFRDIVKNPEVVHGMFIIYVTTKKSCQQFTFVPSILMQKIQIC